MIEPFILSPRYRLDDESLWLIGIDPSRHYWLRVNGSEHEVTIPGLNVSSLEEWKQAILKFRSLQPGEEMEIERAYDSCKVHCVSANCYAIATKINNASVWHLFDRETLQSLLMTSHPDWQCAPQDVELGRKLLARSFAQVTA